MSLARLVLVQCPLGGMRVSLTGAVRAAVCEQLACFPAHPSTRPPARPTPQVERVLLARSGVLLLTWRDASGGAAALRGALRAALPGCAAKQPEIIHSSLLRVLSDTQLDAATIDEIAAETDAWTHKVGRPRPGGPWLGAGGQLRRAWLCQARRTAAVGRYRPKRAQPLPPDHAARAWQQLATGHVAHHPPPPVPARPQLRGRSITVGALWHVCEREYSTIQGERRVLPLGGGGGGG